MEGSSLLLEEERKPLDETPTLRWKYTKPVVFGVSIVAIIAIVLAVVFIAGQIKGADNGLPTDPLERAKKLMEKTPLLDSHNDLPWQYRGLVNNNVSALNIRQNLSYIAGLQTDIPRIQAGRLGAQIWSVYVSCSTPAPVQATLEQIDVVYRMAAGYPDVFKLVVNSDDILPTFQAGKVSSLIGMEGGHSINSSMGALRSFYYLGARYMTLTHTCSTPWAQSANDNSGTVIGLTDYGRQIVLEMNRIGMMVDISHVADQTMQDVLATSLAPIIFSHSNARALCDHIRNVPDEVLAQIPANGGVVMVVFYPTFVCERFRLEGLRLANITGCNTACVDAGLIAYQATADACAVSDVVAQIDYLVDKTGIDHVGIGADYDGVNILALGLEDVSKYPALFAALVEKGYSDEDINKILSGNIIRVLNQVEQVAHKLQQSNPIGP